MVLHIVSMVAFFVDQLTYEPIVLQCAPAEPGSWVKWLLPTTVQTVVSLASITAGVLIAVWSFKKNRQSEHEQWVRDQQLEEWRELISVVASVEDLVPALIEPTKIDPDALRQAILRVIPYLRNRLFIKQDLQIIEFESKWKELFVSSIDNRVVSPLDNLSNAKNYFDNARTHNNTSLEIESAYNNLKDANIKIRNRYCELQEKLLQASQKCLGT